MLGAARAAHGLVFLLQFFFRHDDRLALQEILEDVGSKFVLPHVNIFYCFGGLVLTSFLVQVATRFALTFYYRPSAGGPLTIFDSLMVCCIVLHVCRVYLTGGFKKPREVTWITGVALAVCTVSFGVTGYSLPYDQVGYWALRIVSGESTDVHSGWLIRSGHRWGASLMVCCIVLNVCRVSPYMPSAAGSDRVHGF